MPINPRPDWKERAREFGFGFHTMYGEPYWDESAYYQFSLKQIEQDLEAPTEEIHQMCLDVVNRVVADDELMRRFRIPECHWNLVRDSWQNGDPSLYSRFDFAYAGQGPAKLYENNADTPTSLFETGFWQWLWLEDNVDRGALPRQADQFNSLQEKLVNRFRDLQFLTPDRALHFACCKDTEEDRGTVQYLQDCAREAGISEHFVFMEDIGVDAEGRFADLKDQVITWMFKLYPWEFMFREAYGEYLEDSNVRWLEPPWKSILSNKALLPTLWKLHPGHPNLLPAFFEDELSKAGDVGALVKKPIFSREGANISIVQSGVQSGNEQQSELLSDGPYGEEGFVYQALHPLPKFGANYTLVGSWLIDDEAAGISIREDSGLITQDSSRYLPHIIL
ncbi:glutathionylspermidine synthase family protein [Microbulbifer aggregans]|uniref:glutathionylspermidine synthase family protein n=1 Tax=Microbulbifer aggregans TaxID=1769779 RepID=UPI001CFE4A9E